MNCPTCGTNDLYRAERAGVEIDICATCGGVWLDRGELDTLLDQPCADESASTAAPDTHRQDRFRRFRRVYDGYVGGSA